MENEEQQNEELENEDDEHKEEDFENLVTILSTEDQGIAAVAKTILEEAGINYYVKGEGIQSMYGIGIKGVGGFDPLTDPIEIQVIQEDEDAAIELLKDVEKSEPLNDPGLTSEESNDPDNE